MNKKNLQLLFVAASFLIFAVANVETTFAQSSNQHTYQVLTNKAAKSAVIVDTLSDGKITSVAIQRKKQPTHYYTSYLEVRVSTMRIDNK